MRHKTIVHDPELDKPVVAYYAGISREMYGCRFRLSQGESGYFYAKNLLLAVEQLARYGKDHYGYNTFDTPIQVNVFPGNFDE